jgi:hypothetical protein
LVYRQPGDSRSGNSRRFTNTYTDTNAECYPNAYTDAERYPDAYTDAERYPDAYTNAECYPNADTNTERVAHADAKRYTNADANTHCVANAGAEFHRPVWFVRLYIDRGLHAGGCTSLSHRDE